MAIQTIIVKKSKDEKALVVTMLFTDGAKIKFMDDLRVEHFNLENFKARVRAIRDSLAHTDDSDALLTEGPFDPTAAPVDPPDPPPELTPEEKARNKFFKDLRLRRQMETAIGLKLKTPDDQDYIDQVTLVSSEFLPEYVAFL